MDPWASDGTDSLDVHAPPPPPSGAFDARLKGPEDDYFADIRASASGPAVFEVAYQAASGRGPITLAWDPESAKQIGQLRIRDRFTGQIFGPVDMSSTSSLDVSVDPSVLGSGLAVHLDPVATRIEVERPRPAAILEHGYPNPFSSTATIVYTVDHHTDVTLRLVDLAGREVAMLVRERSVPPGRYEAHVNGSLLASGTYHCILESGTQRSSVLLTVVR